MSKAKFTYDESGATFFYFVLSFLALILIPSTYYLWPKQQQDDQKKLRCSCQGCKQKDQRTASKNSGQTKSLAIKTFIIIGWVAFFLVAYKCATIQHEYINYDPFEILGIREDASDSEIKKAYRQLSLVWHPDKEGGSNDKFVKISKAYAALTDPEARENYRLHGHPDGPGATSFGIALPSWIVEKENSFVVLGIYALIFMVALPVSVGLWWYKSVKFGSDKVLINTSELYYYFIHKTPHMAMKRVIMILAASLEFARSHNPEIIERESDNVEVPRLIRDFTNFDIKNKEKPLCFSYSVKARAILQAHLSRMQLPQNTLEEDRCLIVGKCPYLIQEFVHCVAQLITLALSGRIQNIPTLYTLENAMKLGPLVVQAMWEYQSQLLQLPYFSEDTLRQLERKKIKVRTIEGLARMKDQDRRNALKSFTDSQYEEMMFVLSSMPIVHIDCKIEVIDDEDPNVITSGAIVTAAVKLKRKTMKDLSPSLLISDEVPEEKTIDTDANQTDAESDNNNNADQSESERENKAPVTPAETKPEPKPEKQGPKISNGTSGDGDKVQKNSTNTNKTDAEEDDEEWDRKFQERILKKQKVLESRPKKSHPVHCPYFPEEKQEFWWVYMKNKKREALTTAPLLVTNLVDTEEIELKFTAPAPGVYTYTVVVRSDSYVGNVIERDFRIEVKPMKEYIEIPYDLEEDDAEMDVEEEHSSVEDSDLLTDTDSD